MIFELNKDNFDLAVAEVLALAQTEEYELFGNILVCDCSFDVSRLAYTKRVLETIFVSDKVEEVDWKKYYKNNFCIRSNITSKELELAKIVWDSVENPKVLLIGSDSEFWFFFFEGKVICGKKVWLREEKFYLRRPDLRPGFFPVSMKPKLARALVNLSGVREGKLWDPFCGTGGLLLEAAMIGLEVEGTDIDPALIRAAKKNFAHYNVEGEFSVGDARSEIKECDAVVCDPPYGRRASLRKLEVKELYEAFLNNVFPHVKRVVLMIPHTYVIESPYKIVFQTDEYIHSSLTRRIIVFEK
jgi:tRNA (guanine10-N2)-dimethyltransferase